MTHTRAHRSRPANIAGQVFGRLTVLHRSNIGQPGRRKWLCSCSCGQTTIAIATRLVDGQKRSCGCLVADTLRRIATRHGKTQTAEHRVWCHIITRCHCASDRAYAAYGGRGITVCARWRDSFAAFLEDMGTRPTPKHSIDRRNNNGPYSPDNCRWVLRPVQNRNKRNNHLITFRQKTLCLAEWATLTGLSQTAIRWRLKRGWSVEDSLTRPSRQAI